MVNSGEARMLARLAGELQTDLNILEQLVATDGDYKISVGTPLGQRWAGISGVDKEEVENRASGTYGEVKSLAASLTWP